MVFLFSIIAFACSGGNDDAGGKAGNTNANTSTENENAATNAENAGGVSGGTTRSGSAGIGGTAPSANTGGKSGKGGKGGSQTNSSAGRGGQATAGARAKSGCTPSKWVDPGTVPNPKVVAVAPDVGTTKHVFGAATGMEKFDYEEEEFFFSNSSPEPYTTRLVVRRPRDPAKFSGIVYQEWLNVSGMMDVAVMWGTSREYLMREGHVHVSVSAQLNGIGTLQSYDAERYASLNHPGDQASDAIFSQAAMAIRSQTKTVLGPCMPVQKVYAVGQSQSAMRLSSYVTASQPTYKIFDGFLIHSGPQPASDDPGLPVMVIHTMTEGNCSPGEGPNMVCWAVAGATHNDARIMEREIDEVGSCFGLTEPPFKCLNPMNEFPAWRAYNAALDWLNRWVRDGKRPPAGDPFVGSPPLSEVDQYGNALGGVRLPDIDVPIATHNDQNAALNPLDFLGLLACGLSGNSVYFSESELLKIYPTHEEYVKKYTAAADETLKKGYLLKADYNEAIAQAKAAPIPK